MKRYKRLMEAGLLVIVIAAAALKFDAHNRLADATAELFYDYSQFEPAHTLWRWAAGNGYAHAQYRLAHLYENGLGRPKSLIVAADWFKRAADQNHKGAQTHLGHIYLDGSTGRRDLSQAAKYFALAAVNDYAPALHMLGYMRLNGLGMQNDDADAFLLFSRAAQKGYPPAYHFLGYLFTDGRGVAKNEQEGFRWYLKAAKTDNGLAQFDVGVAYRDGRGVHQDYGEAQAWFGRAIVNNVPDAMVALGEMYFHGLGVSQSLTNALKLYEGAARRGSPAGMDAAGVVALRQRKLRRAHFWFQQAANQGHAMGQYNLAQTYYNSAGVRKDIGLAIMWFRRAARQNIGMAQAELCNFNAKGQGMPLSPVRAYSWCTLAKNRPMPANYVNYVANLLTQIEPMLTKAQRESALRQAAEFLPAKEPPPVWTNQIERESQMYRNVMSLQTR